MHYVLPEGRFCICMTSRSIRDVGTDAKIVLTLKMNNLSKSTTTPLK